MKTKADLLLEDLNAMGAAPGPALGLVDALGNVAQHATDLGKRWANGTTPDAAAPELKTLVRHVSEAMKHAGLESHAGHLHTALHMMGDS